MKFNVVSIIPFVLTFMVITGLIVYLNSSYNNIFEFDFSPKRILLKEVIPDSTVSKTSNVNEPIEKSPGELVEMSDSLIEVSEQTSIINESENNPINEKPREEKINSANVVNASLNNSNNDYGLRTTPVKRDTMYFSWVKRVTKIYESMEPGKASKIIQSYSDNVARDIIFTMNKKNAAKIVAQFNVETANRIINYE